MKQEIKERIWAKFTAHMTGNGWSADKHGHLLKTKQSGGIVEVRRWKHRDNVVRYEVKNSFGWTRLKSYTYRELEAKLAPAPAAPKNNEEQADVRLKVGDIIRYERMLHAVWFVNHSRAAVLPCGECYLRQVKDEHGELTAFESAGHSVNISPNSEVEILHRLGLKGLVSWLEENKETNKAEKKVSMSKNNKAEKTDKPSKKDEAPKLGALGGFLGHSVTGAIRAMGAAGWNFKEARKCLDDNKVAAADNTIRIQLHKGKSGAQEPANISKKELADLRPVIEKPVKKDKAGKAAKSDKASKPAKKNKPAKEEVDEEAEVEEKADENAEE